MANKRVVMITGASGLIGSCISLALLKQGMQVAMVDIDFEGINMEDFSEHLDDALLIVSDVCSSAGAEYAVNQSLKKFRRLDAAIHAAYPRSAGWGAVFGELLDECVFEDVSKQIGGAILFSQTVISHFQQVGSGNLIHIASIQGVCAPKFDHYVGTDMTSPIEYAASKSALISVTRYLAKYLKGKNVRVNCISPGGVFANQPDSFIQKYKSSCCSKGMLAASDIVGAVKFLLSEQSQFINGQNLIVDDGWSL